jgi:hypothetical protein
MSELADRLFGAMKEVKEVVQSVAPGLNAKDIAEGIGAEAKRLGVQGQMEMASAIFGQGAFVPYGPGQYTPSNDNHQSKEVTPSPEVQEPQMEQSRGRGM